MLGAYLLIQAPGQRILCSQSDDGVTWTRHSELFPNMSTNSHPAALFAEPVVHLNGRIYAAASPTQFCLYPDQYQSVLLLRRVNDNDFSDFGPLFWASATIPAGFEIASALRNVSVLPDMDAQTKNDVMLLTNASVLPCAALDGFDGTLKCEACFNGCQLWASIPKSLNLANERTHYTTPDGSQDVLLYRSNKNMLYFSSRAHASTANDWSEPVMTAIPDDNSNINAGFLPDGRRFLLSNSLKSSTIRDPISIVLSHDGWSFDTVYSAVSCTQLNNTPGVNPCKPRFDGLYKNPGPSYPSSVVVLAAPLSPAIYVAHTNNKEDVWVTRLPLSSL